MSSRVQNKAPAPVQITAEQLLRESFERQEPKADLQLSKASINDQTELLDFQARKRKEFEDVIRRKRTYVSNWIQYATWELEQNQFARARSVFERALDVLPTHVPLWLKYIDSETKTRNINHARNLLDRATTLMPRVDKFWYKYVYMEDTLGNIANTRHVFDRWMKWNPPESVWMSYIKFELRNNEHSKIRQIFERLSIFHPTSKNFVSWAKHEEQIGEISVARNVFALAVDSLKQSEISVDLFNAFAQFEARQKDYDRARSIFKFGLGKLNKPQAQELLRMFAQFEKQYGDTVGAENIVLQRRKLHYENVLNDDPYSYDSWLSLIDIEQALNASNTRVRNLYEKAVSAKPLDSNNKDKWRRYIYLWLFFAIFEETVEENVELARKVFLDALKTVPHKNFTFSKLWLRYAEFLIRQDDLSSARKVLGRAIGTSPTPKLFREYIALEAGLEEYGRCRILYEKWIGKTPISSEAWMGYATMESKNGDYDRASAIYSMAIAQPSLDDSDIVWKTAIDFEFEHDEYEKVRDLYNRLLQQSCHAKIWIAFASFEVSHLDDDDDDPIDDDHASKTAIVRARNVFERAYREMADLGMKEDRAILLDAWMAFEKLHGDENSLELPKSKRPEIVMKRRQLEDGTMEEYKDYLFPEDKTEKHSQLSRLLQAAREWKEKEGV